MGASLILARVVRRLEELRRQAGSYRSWCQRMVGGVSGAFLQPKKKALLSQDLFQFWCPEGDSKCALQVL